MSWKGDMLKAGIDSDGVNIDLFESGAVLKIEGVTQSIGAVQAAQANTAAATAVPLVITFNSNTPTPAATQTIENGTVPTVAEFGQFAANQEVVCTALLADIAALRVTVNALLAKLRTNGIIAT